MLTKRLAIGSTLVTRRIIDDPTCKRCCIEEETSDHLFFGCQHAQAIWRGTHIFHSAFFDPNLTLEDKINVILQSCNNKRQYSLTRQIPLWTLWRIWKSRNLVYQQRSSEWRKEAQQAVTDAYEWADQGTIENLTSNNRTEEPIHGWMKPDPGYINVTMATVTTRMVILLRQAGFSETAMNITRKQLKVQDITVSTR